MGEGPEGRGWACWRRRLPEAGEPAADHLSVEAKVERKILERGTSHSGMLGGGRPSKAGLKEETVVQAGFRVPRGDGDRGVGHWVVKPQTAEATWQSGCQSSSFGGSRGLITCIPGKWLGDTVLQGVTVSSPRGQCFMDAVTRDR